MKLQVTTINLFEDDVRELKRRAKQQRTPWQTFTRALVHTALTPPITTPAKRTIR